MDVWTRDGRLGIEGPEDQGDLARDLLAHKAEVLAALEAEQAAPWPTSTWGPLLPEHFEVRSLGDLERLPVVRGGFTTTFHGTLPEPGP